MNQRSPCDRSWQLEALRDGRLVLDAEARSAFERHVRDCARCQAEQRALESLAAALRTNSADVDDLQLRRMREQLLDQAKQQLLTRAKPTPVRRLGRGALALAAALALGLLARQSVYDGTAVNPVTVEPEPGASWQRKREGGVERVDLSAGSLLFRVTRSAKDPRLSVRVPDGEIEDLGTTFRVSVRDGKTREIEVHEGRVLFHRPGARALYLVAGSHWTAPPETGPAPKPTRDALPAPTVVPAPVDGFEQPPPVPSPDRPQPTRRRVAPARAAQVGLQTADDPLAQERAREDAAYLQIVALVRERRAGEARRAALAYLRAFPAGFRRVEVARVATSSTTRPDAGP